LPYRINTVLGLLTLSFIAAKVLVKKDLIVSKNILLIDILTLFVVVVSLISMSYNQTSDFSFNRPNIALLIDIFAAYFLMLLLKKQHRDISFQAIANFYIGAALLQVFFSVVFFFSRDIRDMMLGLLTFGEMGEEKMSRATFRFVGFGQAFAGAGVTYGFILILIMAIIKNNIFRFKKIFFYICSYFFIFTVGMMTGRTTLIGAAFSLLLLVYKDKNVRLKKQYLLIKILFCLILVSIVIYVIFLLNDNLKNFMMKSLNFGFELFINFFNKGELSTTSSTSTLESFIFPDNTKTWIIGDGYYSDPANPGWSYYMGSDVGYTRYLFYFGIIGTLVYFLLNASIIYCVSRKNEKKYNFVFFVFFLSFLALNIKGDISLSRLLLPFLFVNKLSRK
jgi:hypothetical protein